MKVGNTVMTRLEIKIGQAYEFVDEQNPHTSTPVDLTYEELRLITTAIELANLLKQLKDHNV